MWFMSVCFPVLHHKAILCEYENIKIICYQITIGANNPALRERLLTVSHFSTNDWAIEANHRASRNLGNREWFDSNSCWAKSSQEPRHCKEKHYFASCSSKEFFQCTTTRSVWEVVFKQDPLNYNSEGMCKVVKSLYIEAVTSSKKKCIEKFLVLWTNARYLQL